MKTVFEKVDDAYTVQGIQKLDKMLNPDRKFEGLNTQDSLEEEEPQDNIAGRIKHFVQKFGKMLYLVSIIAAYWVVFVPR
jgi:hypothetical protein